MPPENLNTQYQHQLVQHNTRTKQTRNNALSLSLSFSLAFYPFLSLFEEEENDDDDFTTTFIIIIIIIITVVSTTRL